MLTESIYKSCTSVPGNATPTVQSPPASAAGHELRAARAAFTYVGRAMYQRYHRKWNRLFLGCTLRCVFCSELPAEPRKLRENNLRLPPRRYLPGASGKGAANINLVTGTQFAPSIIRALDLAKPKLQIPVVFNCGDMKDRDDPGARRLCRYLASGSQIHGQQSRKKPSAPDYFGKASTAIKK